MSTSARAPGSAFTIGEQFENDGSIGSTSKTVKRVMAGEYSRELSVKVFAGQCRLAEWDIAKARPAMDSDALIDEGMSKAELSPGQQKSFQTDRVVLSLRPADEVENVRRMYRLFVEDGLQRRRLPQYSTTKAS
jgi:hypothetical protein